MEPVVEQIADAIYERLLTINAIEGVTRPKRINDDAAGDYKITITQGAQTENPRLSCPGNPPVVAFNQIFQIAGELRPSEDDSTTIDTLRNRFAAEIREALTADADWHQFDGLAVNAMIGPARTVTSENGAGVKIDLLVQYRHPENDPYTVSP